MARPKNTKTTSTAKTNIVKNTPVQSVEEAVKVETATVTEIDTTSVSTPTVEKVVEKKDYSKKAKIPKDYDIPVKSNVQGKLIYTSKKTGYTEEWDEMGTIAYLEYDELVSMRNSHKKFFEDNWVLIEDTDDYTADEIYYSLNIEKYYKNIAIFETLDDVFDLSIADIEAIVPTLSNGYRRNIASRAMQLITDGDRRMDSTAKIKAFEKALNVNLRED